MARAGHIKHFYNLFVVINFDIMNISVVNILKMICCKFKNLLLINGTLPNSN